MVPEELSGQLEKLGNDWADAEAAGSLYEETKKSFRARLVVKYLPDAKTVAKAEVMAEADEEYMKYVSDMVSARQKATRAKVKYDAYRIQIELLRSQEATLRTQIKSFGG